jgi:hypothetical protein
MDGVIETVGNSKEAYDEPFVLLKIFAMKSSSNAVLFLGLRA